ncbi:SusC/RagA family TonB-linked outer membrane protein [Labilibaculum manganireducens]|uniref:SusC/RagA family TonB-linked outer membrane protein n=1 Tax=Labilibaculum manganireducens TaxID=1940525 RepID=UPI0029F46020|nr:SusC/RagA family TonB-linked outer membrane protein [Labilibaculum manganireducens]
MKKCYLRNLHSSLTNPLGLGSKIGIFALLCAMMVLPFSANANVNTLTNDNSSVSATQQVVTGAVTEDSGMSLPGVSVVVKGTTTGTVTDIDGKFEITVPESTSILVFSFVGMQTQEITVGSQSVINVVMTVNALEVAEVVVTALGIKREKKALGYSVQDIKSDEITQGADANLASALEGKIAGVQINQSGGGVGGSSRIEIRGASSLTGNNAPLWVVDGVPFNDSREGEDAGVFGGVDKSGAAFDINPDDIESVSVLKGPNAAALYGSRAGNGVILVTTKKGKKNAGLGIAYSGSVTISEAAYFLDMQDKFGQGTEGVYDKNGTSSWGPEMKGQMLESWTGEMIPYEAQTNRIEDFTRTGVSQKHNLSFTGGNEDGSYRASMGKDISNGIYDGHKVEKMNFDLRADYNINPWLNIDTKVSYMNTKGKERPEMGFYSYMSYFNQMPMNIRTQDLKPGYDMVGGNHVEKLYTTSNASFRNPYFLQDQQSYQDERYRTFGYFAANMKLTSDLKLRLKYGLDYYREDAQSMYKYADNVYSNHPDYNTMERFFKEENYEFLLSYNKDLSEDFAVSLNVGGNKMYTTTENLSSKSGKLPSEGNYFLGYGTNISSSESISEEEVQSIYGFGQVAYKNMLFLDFTARNDWSSTLPDDNNSYFYPSVSVSGVLSEMVEMPSWITYAKLRGSWAQVGKATDPYKTSMLYTIGTGNFNLLKGSVPSILVNPDLKPEISSSTEFGFDVRMFNNRIGIDFTLYDENTQNQIMPVDMDQSAGYQQKLINAGKISNKGVEIMLSTTPIKTKDFTLDLNFNFAANTTKVKELDADLKEYRFGDINGSPMVVGIEGEKLGDIKGYKYRRNDAGAILVDSEGLPMRTEQLEVIGNLQADWTGSIGLKADYKGLYVSALLSIQQGGDIVSITEKGAVGAGTAKRTAENNRNPYTVNGFTEGGVANAKSATAEKYWGRISSIDEEFVYDASYMKLKEVAVGYSIPQSFLSKIGKNPIKTARISIVGRNLFYFYKDTPGTAPDASAYSSRFEASAFDFSPVPATRTYGFSLNLGF